MWSVITVPHYTEHFKHTVPSDEEAIEAQFLLPLLVCCVQVAPAFVDV